MSKKRKTRREKIIAQLRQKAHIAKKELGSKSQMERSSNTNATRLQASLLKPPASSQPLYGIQMSTAMPTLKNYSYVIHDMKKTTIILSAIFFINVIIFLLLEKNIIKLGFLG